MYDAADAPPGAAKAQWKMRDRPVRDSSMSRSAARVLLGLALCSMATGSIFPRVAGQGPSRLSTKNGDWPHYNADLKGTRYSPLEQIQGSNFNRLQVAGATKTPQTSPR